MASTFDKIASHSRRHRGPYSRLLAAATPLFEALRELMVEKRWEKIRVQDVLDRSGLGRSTFYAHFNSKFDLLTAAIPDVVLPIAGSDQMVPDLLPLFQHVQEMQRVLYPLLSQTLYGEITDTFHRQMAATWCDHLQPRCTSAEQAEFAADLLAAGFLTTAKRWVVAGCDRPASDVCANYERYARVLIREAIEADPTTVHTE